MKAGTAELRPQLGDVDVDGPGAAGELAAPGQLQQAVAAEDDAGVGEQRRQQVELARGQLDRRAGDGGGARGTVELDLADREGVGAAPAAAAPARRRIAFTRATSSRGEKGLTT